MSLQFDLAGSKLASARSPGSESLELVCVVKTSCGGVTTALTPGGQWAEPSTLSNHLNLLSVSQINHCKGNWFGLVANPFVPETHSCTMLSACAVHYTP